MNRRKCLSLDIKVYTSSYANQNHLCCYAEASNISSEVKSLRDVEAPIQEDDDEVIVMPGITISQDTLSEQSNKVAADKETLDATDFTSTMPFTTDVQTEKRDIPHYTKVSFYPSQLFTNSNI